MQKEYKHMCRFIKKPGKFICLKAKKIVQNFILS